MNTKRNLVVALCSAGLLGLATSGCNREEAPAKTQADVTAAQAEGAKKVEEVRHEAAQDEIDAQKSVSEAHTELAHETAEGDYKVAVARAEAQHQTSLEACESMSGEARDACKKQADVTLYDAKASADAVAKANDPKR